MVFPNVLTKAYIAAEAFCRDKGLIAGKSGRHMKFPYTMSAKIAQFPIFYYMKHNNIWMYYPLGLTAGFYMFTIFHSMSNTAENKESWAESQRRAAEKEHSH